MIQKTFYVFRKTFFDLKIDRVTIKDNHMVIYEGNYGDEVTVPFPDSIIPDIKDQEAVLSYLACNEAISWMHPLFEKLLNGKRISQTGRH